jgi:hypothetical protein
MNAQNSDLRLIEQCDRAIQKCAWCLKFGHEWNDCEEFDRKLKTSVRVVYVGPKVWQVLIIFAGGVSVGLWVRALLEWM